MIEILITNDDGWGAKGILTLCRLMRQLGHVTIVAPDSARSGQSNAITVNQALHLNKISSEWDNVDIYITNGTPADCIKLAINVVYGGKKPDLLVSGINHGSNAAVNVIYSGTMGACLVGAENSIPSIGFSICDHHSDADFSHLEPYILPITRQLISQEWQYGLCFNINAPIGKLKGVRLTRQCEGHWHKEMIEHTDDNGNKYYMLGGEFCNHEPEAEDTDEWALNHGYIAITPTTVDMTDYKWNGSIDIG